MKKKKVILIIVIMVVIVGGGILVQLSKKVSTYIKIGVITDLTGPAAYWGESTQVGAQLAVDELRKGGVNVDLIIEDYQLDATKAVSAAQKLVNVDRADAIYAEFNPAAISVGSFLKDKNILYVYDAAVTSPLKDSPYAFKTYLDYQTGCKAVAQKFKDEGINKIGVLKVNLEFGDLCLAGVSEIYGENIITEGYNLGNTDFRTQLLKINSQSAGAVINVGFEGDTYNTLKVIRDLKYKMAYGTVDDTITDKVKNEFSKELKGSYSFGFAEIDPSFSAKLNEKLDGKKLVGEYGAALAYTHIKQMAQALNGCNKDLTCVKNKLDNAKANETIGFKKFTNKIAELGMAVKQY